MTPLLALLSLLLVSHLATSQITPPFCDPNDKQVLLRIKHNLGNPLSLSSWDLNNTECGWPSGGWDGVKTNEKGHVTSLRFSRANDIYAIPLFLDQLPSLTEISFYIVPNLNGPIPPYMSNLTNLASFMMFQTNLTGTIPDVLGCLVNLEFLNFAWNKLTGSIPDFLGHLTRLTLLNLSNNSLTGPIPISLAKLTKLDTLQLYSNKLSGPIPDFLGHRLTKLSSLVLHSNKLSGPIPESLSLLHGTPFLSFSNNHLTGPVPKSLAKVNTPGLELAGNKLTGDASFLFDKNRGDISWIDISNNLFKFDLTNVDLAPGLTRFNISHNMIHGRLPKMFYQLEKQMDRYVDVSYNELCGPIPNGRRLKRVNPDIFAHNKCLCGGPLPACK